jgi:hypothetical protein
VSGRVLVVLAGAAALALVGAYAALGGGRYEPEPTADPCAARTVQRPRRDDELTEHLALAAVDGAACDLGVSREEIVLAIVGDRDLDAFAREHGIPERRFERALRRALLRAIDEADRLDVVGGPTAALLRTGATLLPLDVLLDQLRSG